MTASRTQLRAAALLAVATAILPAAAARAALPIDIGGARTTQQSASDDSGSSTADDGRDDTTTASDDGSDASDDDATADDGDSSDSTAIDGDDASDDDVDQAATAAAASAPSHGAGARKPGRPRSVDARLDAFDRISVHWRAGGGAKVVRWIVTLRSGKTGRLVFLGHLGRVAEFRALKPGVRYTATVTAVASNGTRSVASDTQRTPSAKKAVSETKRALARAEQAAKRP